MGVCQSTEFKEFKQAAERSEQLDQFNRKARSDEYRTGIKIKLLLLGAEESGKSTILKQLKIIYGDSFYLEERAHLATLVHSNIIANAQVLANAAKLEDSSIASDLAQIINAQDTSVLNGKIAAVIKRLWADPGAQAAWNRRSQYHIQDAFSWYMNEIDRISEPGYVPSVEDVLRARVRTTVIVEQSLTIDGVDYDMYDVSGQRNARRKWIHYFDDVTAIIFVVDLSAYDELARMEEAACLFDEICNLNQFKNTSIILFLNKYDLFREKLKTTPVRIDSGPETRYESFRGPYVNIGTLEAEFGSTSYEAAYEAAREFFLQMFLARNQQQNREIYSHSTCAVDKMNIKVIFNACKDYILKPMVTVSGSGYMD